MCIYTKFCVYIYIQSSVCISMYTYACAVNFIMFAFNLACFSSPLFQHCSTHGLDWDCTILQYYERLAQLQARGETISHTTLQTIFSQIQSSIAPQSMLSHWAQQIYQSSTHYWTFKKQVQSIIKLTNRMLLTDNGCNGTILCEHVHLYLVWVVSSMCSTQNTSYFLVPLFKFHSSFPPFSSPVLVPPSPLHLPNMYTFFLLLLGTSYFSLTPLPLHPCLR